jgi:hypothetical protein
MNADNRCPRCGGVIPPDAPRGSCPVCLLRKAFDDEDGTGTGATLLPAATGASVLNTLSGALGAVPRVLLRDTGPVTGPGPVV